MPVFNPQDVVQDTTSAPAADVPRKPPPGLLHSAYRGFVSTMEGLDQLMANTSGIVAKLPNTPNIAQFSKDAQAEADRRKAELEKDTAEGNAPQTTGEKLTEGVVGGVGRTVPYLAARTPLGAGAVGTLENVHKGPVEAIKSGATSALYSKAGEVVGGVVGQVAGKASRVAPTLSRTVPKFVKRGVTGAVTAGALAPPGQRAEQAIVGGVAGATQGEPKTPNEIRAAKLQAATGKTGENAWESYRIVGHRLEETARLTGKNPRTIKELQENVEATGPRLNNEFETYLTPIESQTLVPQTVADAIRSEIFTAEVSGKTKEEQETGKVMEERAREFEKTFTLRELDDLRKVYFERLKGVSSETLKARGSGDIRADRAAEKAIKDLEYDLVDRQAQAQGKPPGYIRNELKTQQAHLIQISDALIRRKNMLEEKEGIEKGTPLMQQADATLAVHPGGGFVGSLHGIWKKIFGDPESFKEANKRVETSFPVKTGTPANRVPSVVAGAQRDQDKTQDNQQGTRKPVAIKMRAPNGTTKVVPFWEVDHWKSKGAEVVQ